MRAWRYLLLGCWGLAGCVSEPVKVQPPAAALPPAWQSATPGAAGDVDAWWREFRDPQLDQLVEQALRRNNDVAAAAIRVRRADVAAALVNTNRTPSVAVGVNSGLTHTFSPSFTTRSSGASAVVNYEADPWGKLAGQRREADWEAQAVGEDCLGVAAAVTYATARLYWQIAYLNRLLALSEADIEYARKTLDLVRAKQAAGAVSALSAAQSELYLANLRAAHTQLMQQRTESRHALAILFDQPPETPVAERDQLPDAAIPPIAAGLPASLLGHRPDLRAAELRLRENWVNIDVTRTSFYPTLNLTGGMGTASNALLSLLQNPVLTLGAGLALPFVQWNTAKLNLKVSEHQYQEAVTRFRQQLYTALAEVEDGLSARNQYLAEEEHLQHALEQARKAEAISRLRYQSGLTEVQLWLDMQLSLRGAERAVVINRYNQLNTQASLYRSLGIGLDQGGRAVCGAKNLSQ